MIYEMTSIMVIINNMEKRTVQWISQVEPMQAPFSYRNLGPIAKGVAAMPAPQQGFGEHVCTGRPYGTLSTRRKPHTDADRRARTQPSPEP